LHYACKQSLSFHVGRPNEGAGTTVGHTHDEWAGPDDESRPLRVALLGCGVVGRGVYESLQRYRKLFEIRHVLVQELARYPRIDHLTTDPSLAWHESIDVVIVAIPGTTVAHALITAALRAGKCVITPNKAAVAAHGASLAPYTRGIGRRLWYSAAVGGAMPALETLVRLKSSVRSIRGIINSTCGVVMDAWAQGRTRTDAVALAQAQGFAEANPVRDLSGRDSADKLSLLIEAAFGQWIGPDEIRTRGIDIIVGDPTGYKLIARATQTPQGISAVVAPERPAPGSFLGQSAGPENRLEIELLNGTVIRLRGQGAGRWPTTVSVLGDLHEVARRFKRTAAGASVDPQYALG
jgi:homoserine dehydrogenase